MHVPTCRRRDADCRHERQMKVLIAVYATCAVLACVQLTTQTTADTRPNTTLQGAAQVELLHRFTA